ncbi:MAG: hypothetical protein A2Z20_07350 [Bdellovibrionales bacterium RBG_16_40_8]|nr:MAG: hypothetical protein A2Z20_07350 [Bdellovibrionales bacterium RBG_16_40_8]
MKYQRSGLFRYILILILVIALVRFSPVIVRVIQATAIGARGYWWAILPALVISWVIWRMMKRGSVGKKYGYQFESQRLRDVTDSGEGKTESKISYTESLTKKQET